MKIFQSVPHKLYGMLFGVVLSGVSVNVVAVSADFEAGLQLRGFTQDSPRQSTDITAAVRLQGNFYHEWNDGADAVEFVPWVIVDSEDRERRHTDIRDLAWIHVADDWELRAGIRKVFWGVTESVHRVDIINQTDASFNPNGEEKLGQPMVNLSWVSDWGIVDVFVMTGHRERIFPGKDGRFQIATAPIFWDKATYASDDEELHVDIALRWQHTLGDWELALSHFSGNSRDPLFTAREKNGSLEGLVPHYTTIDQTGFELLYIWESWIFKAEIISNSGIGERFVAGTAGFEYTQTGIFDSAVDLGWIFEGSADERGDKALSAAEHDVFLGARLGFNDEFSSEMIFGVNVDVESHEQLYVLEFSRRLNDSLKLSLDALVVAGSAPPPAFGEVNAKYKAAPISKDDYVQAELTYFF